MKKRLWTCLSISSFVLICILFSDYSVAQTVRRTTRNTQSQQPAQRVPPQTSPQSSRNVQSPQISPTSPGRVDPANKVFNKQDSLSFAVKSQAIVKEREWHVVLFAVDAYSKEEQKLLPLYGCTNDMLAIQEEWLVPMGVPRNNIRFLHDNAQDAKSKPTAENFRNAVEACLKAARKDDYVLVAVSCHGIACKNKSYLCPGDYKYPKGLDTKGGGHFAGLANAQTEEERIQYVKDHNLIEVAGIIAMLDKSPAANKLLIIDACRAKSEIDREEHDFMKEFQSLRDHLESSSSGLGVLTSCSLGEVANEDGDEDGGRGLFSRCFIDGIRSGNAELKGTLDGKITLAKAYSYAHSQIALKIQELNERDDTCEKQTPELFFNSDSHQFVLAKKTQSKVVKSDVDFVYDTSLFVAQNARQKIDLSSYNRLPENQKLLKEQQIKGIQQSLYASAIEGLNYVALEQPNNANVLKCLSNFYLDKNLFLIGNNYRRLGDVDDKREDIRKALEYSRNRSPAVMRRQYV